MSDQRMLTELTDSIVQGRPEIAIAKARMYVAARKDARMALEAITEGYNIARDLFELEEYDDARFQLTKTALFSALETVESQLRSLPEGETKAAVGSVVSSDDAIPRIAATMIKVAGHRVVSLLGRTSSKELLINAEQADVAALLACLDARKPQGLLDEFVAEVRTGNFLKRFGIVLFSRSKYEGALSSSDPVLVSDPIEAVTKTLEYLLKRHAQ